MISSTELKFIWRLFMLLLLCILCVCVWRIKFRLKPINIISPKIIEKNTWNIKIKHRALTISLLMFILVIINDEMSCTSLHFKLNKSLHRRVTAKQKDHRVTKACFDVIE